MILSRRPFTLLCASTALLALLQCSTLPATTSAKEIEPLADAWTLIGENDTIPAGMHVRIDMTTGEKWVKQITDDEKAASASANDSAAATVAVQVSGDVATTSSTTTENKRTSKKPSEPNYDYDRMHATLSQLPPEEHERMGGLPELVPPTTSPSSSTRQPQYTAAQRRAFEKRMKEIWEQRQEELRKIQQEQLIDLPQVLKTQIGFLQDYVAHGNRSAAQVKADLHDLEYLVTDVDMARDFHTLQGWPWLLAVLVNKNETTTMSDDDNVLTEELQAAAAWVVGTAVQNTGEFLPWVVEPVMLPNGTILTALEGLMDVWNHQITPTSVSNLKQKVLYATSACLRHNPLAQHVFHKHGQPARLQQDLRDTVPDTAHGRKQILRILQLGHDLLLEWQQETNHDDDESLAVVQEFRQAWVTPAWCDVVLDKARVVTRADKRLPIVAAWFSSCRDSWDAERLRGLLGFGDEEEHVDKDTKAIQEDLLQELAVEPKHR